MRYDPDAPPARPLQVLHDGADAGLATLLDAYANASVKRARPPPASSNPRLHASRGLPQEINRIAHYALSACALGNAHAVTAEHLQTALDELRP